MQRRIERLEESARTGEYPSRGWGYSNLRDELSSDRLPWFVCKKLELNTKSPSCFYGRASAFNDDPSVAMAWWMGRGAVKLWSGRGRTGRLGTHFFTQNSWIYFFKGWSPTRDEKFVAKFRRGDPEGPADGKWDDYERAK